MLSKTVVWISTTLVVATVAFNKSEISSDFSLVANFVSFTITPSCLLLEVSVLLISLSGVWELAAGAFAGGKVCGGCISGKTNTPIDLDESFGDSNLASRRCGANADWFWEEDGVQVFLRPIGFFATRGGGALRMEDRSFATVLVTEGHSCTVGSSAAQLDG